MLRFAREGEPPDKFGFPAIGCSWRWDIYPLFLGGLTAMVFNVLARRFRLLHRISLALTMPSRIHGSYFLLL